MSDSSAGSPGAADQPGDERTLVRPSAPATASPSVNLPPTIVPANTAPAEIPLTLVGNDPDHPPPNVDDLSTRSPTRFRPLRAHARGGLGQVFVALDEELGREVALKEIQPPHADDADSRARFLLEAEVTGQLEHPGIVPVYGLGCYNDGRPYYAMRFIRGGSLQDAIRHFHDADLPGRDPGERAMQLRGLLRRFVDVCNALAYAHSKGIIHRDMKPANVMLGEYGETLVVDWGLAKKVGASVGPLGAGSPGDAASVGVDALRSPNAPTPFTPLVTVEGTAVGTPAFMSPEQATGSLDLVGPASDVYSLGATLYALLTGSQPFVGSDLLPTLDKVREGKLHPPREVNPSVPAALEAVCLKAMSLRPEDRYGSAKALAEEIERWLADEPLTAYREPLLVRARRWARRHRTSVTAAAVLLLTAVVALAVTTALVANEKSKTEQQRRMAEDNFQTALRAVDDMLTEAAQEQLASEPRMEKKRRALLERARTYYRKFLEQHGDDPRLRREAALAHKRLGDVSKYLGEYEPARVEYDQAIALLDDLVADHPRETDLRSVLAETHCNLGEAWRLGVHPEQAEAAYTRAVELQRPLTAEAPDQPAYRKELARTLYNRGILFKETGRPGQAEKALHEAVTLLTQLAKDHPKEPTYRQHLARAHLNRGPVLRANKQPQEAEAAYREAIRLLIGLIESDKLTPDYRHELGATYNNLGYLYTATNRPAKAEEAHGRAIALFDRLTLEFPSVPTYRKELAMATNNLAIAMARGSRWDAAEKTFGQALEICQTLTDDHPDVADYQAHHGMALGNLGWLLLKRQQLSDAAAATACVGTRGSVPIVAAVDERSRRQRLTTARHRLEQAMTRVQAALKPNPENPTYLQTLLDQSEYLAEVLLLLGSHAEAAKIIEGMAEVFRTRGADYCRAAELLVRCSTVAQDGEYADRAVEILRKGVAQGFRDAERLNGPALAPLRGREDFRKVLEAVKEATPPRETRP